MNKRFRMGKSSEHIVCGQLLRYGLDVYLPCVDDQAIDLILRHENLNDVRYYDIQVKSVKGYNRIIGVKDVAEKQDKYILIIHYRHENKPDEFFYLTKKQIIQHHISGSDWGDLIFNKQERQNYSQQNLSDLANHILKSDL